MILNLVFSVVGHEHASHFSPMLTLVTRDRSGAAQHPPDDAAGTGGGWDAGAAGEAAVGEAGAPFTSIFGQPQASNRDFPQKCWANLYNLD